MIFRCWRLMTPAIMVWLPTHAGVAAASIAWQAWAPDSYTRWREVPAAFLRLMSFGLGLGWIQTRRLLDDYKVPASWADQRAGASNCGTDTMAAMLRHASTLLFASGSMGLATLGLSLHVRLRCVCVCAIKTQCVPVLWLPTHAHRHRDTGPDSLMPAS